MYHFIIITLSLFLSQIVKSLISNTTYEQFAKFNLSIQNTNK